MSHEEFNPQLDKHIFWPSIITIMVLVLPMCIWPEASKDVLDSILNWITSEIGWIFLLVGTTCFIFMLWLAFGRYAHVRLGGEKDLPEFSKPAWLCMLFCAGIGVSIVNWAFVEPIYFCITPPLGALKGSSIASEYAIMYPMFHWGIIPWSIYIFPAVPIAYSHFVRKQPFLRFSVASSSILGNQTMGWLGKTIDVIVVFAIMGGIGTSLGLGVPLVAGLISDLLGVPQTPMLYAAVLIIWTVMFGVSVWRGLQRGMQIISNINVGIALAMLFIIAFAGPTVFLMRLWTNSMGLLVSNFWRISFWTDPIAHSGFPENWTIFYWGWWFALLPMMGLFVARISKGRTIRELVLFGVLFGSFGCWVYFAIWGGYAMHLELNQILPVSQLLQDTGIPSTVLAILHTLPFSKLVIALFTLLCFFFLATTLDAAAYALAATCTKDLPPHLDPARWNRMLWAIALVSLGTGLLAVGGLKAVQISSVIVAVPMIPVMFLLAAALVKCFHEDFEHLCPKHMIKPEEILETTVSVQDTVSQNPA